MIKTPAKVTNMFFLTSGSGVLLLNNSRELMNKYPTKVNSSWVYKSRVVGTVLLKYYLVMAST